MYVLTNPNAPAFATAQELLDYLVKGKWAYSSLIYFLLVGKPETAPSDKEPGTTILKAYGTWQHVAYNITSLSKTASFVREGNRKNERRRATILVLRIPRDEMERALDVMLEGMREQPLPKEPSPPRGWKPPPAWEQTVQDDAAHYEGRHQKRRRYEEAKKRRQG